MNRRASMTVSITMLCFLSGIAVHAMAGVGDENSHFSSVPDSAPQSAQKDFIEGQNDLSDSLKKLEETIDRAQKAADAASSTDINATRQQARTQINSMLTILDKFGPDSKLTQSINKLQSWISANRTRVSQDIQLTSEQKEELLSQWDKYLSGIDQIRKQYGELADQLKGKAEKLQHEDEYIGEQLLLQMGGNALSALKSMLLQMRESIDVINQKNQSIKLPTGPTS